jgi:hypothetical protein
MKNNIKIIFKILPLKKSPRTQGSIVALYTIFQNERIPLLYKQYQKVQKEGTISNIFYYVSINGIPKPDTNTTKQDNSCINTADEHICKNPQKPCIMNPVAHEKYIS